MGQRKTLVLADGRAYLGGSGLSVSDWFNARCEGTRGTGRWILGGFSNLMELKNEGASFATYPISRGACSTGYWPAYGMLHYMPTGCSCLDPVNGCTSVSRDAVPDLTPEDQRLTKGPAFGRPPRSNPHGPPPSPRPRPLSPPARWRKNGAGPRTSPARSMPPPASPCGGLPPAAASFHLRSSPTAAVWQRGRAGRSDRGPRRFRPAGERRDSRLGDPDRRWQRGLEADHGVGQLVHGVEPSAGGIERDVPWADFVKVGLFAESVAMAASSRWQRI